MMSATPFYRENQAIIAPSYNKARVHESLFSHNQYGIICAGRDQPEGRAGSGNIWNSPPEEIAEDGNTMR
jgi:hypothetical protein